MRALTLDPATVRQAAQGCWPSILSSLGIDVPSGPRRHGPCPACGGKDRFRFDDKDGRGTWLCSQCNPQSGDGFALIRNVRRCDFSEAVRLAADALGESPARSAGRPSKPKSNGTSHVKIWEAATTDTGRIAAYLRSRGLSGDVPSALRLHPGLSYWNGEGTPGGDFPAMVAAVLNLSGDMIGVHRTYLAHDGDGKAPVEDPKKSLGTFTGGAIRLAPHEPGTPLILSEGIETALACQEATGWPVWACVSTAGLEAVQLPEEATAIYIAVDRDRSGAGEKSAATLAQRLDAEGRIVCLVIP